MPGTVPRPLFVYGTLMRGEANHRLLEGKAERIVPGRSSGFRMTSLGPFPMIFPAGDDWSVRGELVLLRPEVYRETLWRLDRFEGEGDLFFRRPCRVVTDDGEAHDADVYVGPDHRFREDAAILSGDWREHTRGNTETPNKHGKDP
ncbi:MAG: gamma-glutamylcyclotransferase [Acidobacteria bacterium]|nr:gamma-glutamylcyclotransferase [Acidobacteriota bacterium]